MKKLLLVASVLLVCVTLVYAQEPEFDHWVFAPLVQKSHVEPTPTPATPPTPPPAVCDCSGNIYNCTDFDTQIQAQACYNYCLQVVGYDIHKLDRDKDGQACESLP